MKKFYVLCLMLLVFTFAGCTNGENNDALIAELTEKITLLEKKIEVLESSNESNKNEITSLKNQLESLEQEFSDLKEKLSAISYDIKVYDLDDESLGNVKVVGKEGDVFFDVLCNKFAVEYIDSEWGPMLKSINNSIIDDNYYLAIYENGEYATTGVDGLVVDDEDVFEFKVECWNTDFDEVDLAIDKIVYKYMKNVVPGIYNSATTFYDYTLTAAINMMIEKGYDKNIFNFDFENSATIKSNLENKDWSSETIQNNFMKGGITLLALDGDTSGLKTALANQSKYNYWQTIVTKALEITNETLTTTIAGFVAPTKAGDSSMMQLCTYILHYTKEELGTAALEDSALTLSSEGIDSFGINGASTAQFVLANCALGINPRDYTATDDAELDTMEILLKYCQQTGLKWQLSDADDKIDLGFSTPQGIASLLAYKALRDKGEAAVIYQF